MRIEDLEWQPIYFAIFSIMVVATVIITGLFNGCPECSNSLEVIEEGTGKGVLYATAIISLMEAIRIMVILPADYLRQKFVESLKQRQKDEGRAEGRSEMRDEFLAWLQNKEEAEREGREFNEPMPGIEGNGGANHNGGAERI